MEHTDRVNDLIFICERMIEILTIENDALRENSTDIMKDRLDEKTKLSLFYERHMRSLKRFPHAFQEVDKELLRTLKELGGEMNELLDENGRLLKIAMESNRRVLRAIAAAARENVPHSGIYSESATVGPKGDQSVAVSINQEL